MTTTTLPMIERRRIEAEILRPVYEELVERLGKEEAQQLLARVIRRSAIAQGESFRKAQGEKTDLDSFAELLPLWTKGGALEIDVKRHDSDHFEFNVTRCRYAEMYREMGLGEIGHILSCNRDGTFCEGYDRRIELTRTQTIMQGADHCDFRYRFNRTRDPA